MGRVAELNLRGNTIEPCLISIDKNTNELVAVRQEHVYIPNEVKGVRLTADEIRCAEKGKPVYVDGMKSNQGKEFDATLQYMRKAGASNLSSRKDQAFNQQTLAAYRFPPCQIKCSAKAIPSLWRI